MSLYISFRESNFSNSNIAVFFPIPLTPGILSELSPINPKKSHICFGKTPYFFLFL